MSAQQPEWKNSQDFKQAVFAADKLLDEPQADPDDDARTVARQFNRMVERYDALATAERTAREELKTAIFGELNRSELEAVVTSMARAVGHTHAAINGVKNTHNALLVLGNKHQAQSVDLPKEKTISLEDIKFGRLQGTRKAIVLDNFAVFNLWRDIKTRMEHVFKALAPSTNGEEK